MAIVRYIRAMLAALCCVVCTPDPARAQTDKPPVPAVLTGTLAKVHRTGAVAIGYRASSVPFSVVS